MLSPTGFEPTALTRGEILLEPITPLVPPEPVEPLDVPGLERATEFTGGATDGVIEPLPIEPLFGEPEPLDLLSLDVGAVGASPHGEALFDQLQVEDEVEVEEEPEAEDSLARYQRDVEQAYRVGDATRLVGAYLALAEALARRGAGENAALIYERVLEHDPANPVARAALARLRSPPPAAPPPEPPVSAGEFVDLGALILDPEPERDTRMRVEPAEPVGDEDKDFLETLTQFKEGIAANLDAADFQAHYDLGIAFKEMGLLDEAIAEFQQALRAPEGRLKASEALGIAFYEKGRYSIAEAVLVRAIDALPGSDDQKIALLYWLGRALEAQGRVDQAVRWYERAMAVDIRFLDLAERVPRLSAGDRS
jgi:tetratricopeptide (TPR) repeat protein